MRQFNKYLSTKVNLYNKFPTEPDLKKIIAFLRYHDFKELKFDDNKFYVNILEENNDSKRFMLNSYHKDGCNWTWIRFIDAGDMCEENPSFILLLAITKYITCVKSSLCLAEKDINMTNMKTSLKQ